MRILQVHNHHAAMGGADEVLDDERDLLIAAGHDVEQFTIPPTDSQGLSALRSGTKAVWNVEAAHDLGRLIDAARPDVVHVHTPFPLLSPAVFRVAARRGVPAVTTLHSFRYSCIAATCFRNGSVCEDCVGSRLKLPGLRHRCYHDSLGASGALTLSLALHRGLGTFRGIDRFITLTPFAKRLLMRDGIPDSQITVKANSVPDPGRAYEAQRERPYVAFAGRLVDVKGIRTLLDAWPMVAPGFDLRIAGDGPLRELVEARAAADPTIEFLGWLSQPDVTELLGRATCTVLPSEWYEGQPLVTLRSLSLGTPMIVSDLENLCEDVVGDGAGTAFRTGDPGALATALTSLGTEPATWEERAVAARRSYLARHTPTTNVESLLRIYGEVARPRT